MPKYIVTGASGFIGTRLTRRLSAAGAKVIAIDIAPPRETLPNVDYLSADVREPLNEKLGQGVDRIYNLAAVHRTPGHPPHEYYDTNVRGALNLTKLADKAQINEIVFTSSISVYGPSEAIMTEESPLKPVSDYGRSKLMAELIHRDWQAGGQSRRLVVVRPGVVFGPGERGNYTFLARALQRGIFAYPGRRSTIKSGGYVDELLSAIDFASSSNASLITFNFAYPTESSTEDIVNAFQTIMGSKRRPMTIPFPLMMAAASSFELANHLGLKSPVHRERILKLVNSTKIKPKWLQDNGYRFSTSLPVALEAWSAETNGAFI